MDNSAVTPRLDEEGFLLEPDDWSEEVALVLARKTGLEELTDKHWLVIRFLRGFYLDQGRAPLNKQLKKGRA